MNLFVTIDLVLLIPLTLAVLYLWLIGIAGIFGRRKYAGLSRPYDFLILIPAYNEALVIVKTLEHIEKLKLMGKGDIVVIADNCDDETANIARNHGVSVLERRDERLRGKGYALRYALDRCNLDEYDAVAIIDADTLVKPSLLEVMARSLASGAGAVQVSNQFYIEKSTSVAHLQQIGNMAENILFYRGRAVLHLPVLLRGTGMAITTEVLKAHPWDAFTVTEDIDYAVGLIKKGIEIDFSAETSVESPATINYSQSYSQKSRWASGIFSMVLRRMIRLIRAAFKETRFALLELALSFLILSRPLLIFMTLIPLGLAPLTGPDQMALFLIWPAIMILALVLYLTAGIFYVDDKWGALKSLIIIPYFAVWLMVLQIRALFGGRKVDWVRTERKA